MIDGRHGGRCVTRRNLLRGGVALIGLGACAGLGARTAFAATGAPYRFVPIDTLADIDRGGIHVNRCDVLLQNADYTYATGDLRLEETNQWQAGSMVVTVPYSPNVDRTWSGTFEARWSGIARDVDGGLLDLELTVSSVRTLARAGSEGGNKRTMVLISYPGEWNQGLWAKSNMTNAGDDDYALPLSVTLRVRFLRSGTNELAHGNYLFSLRDVDTLYANTDYNESIRFISGFDSDVYVYPGTTIDLDANAGWVRATAPRPTDQSPTEELVVMTDPDFTFEWRGCACETALFDSLADWGEAAAPSYGAGVTKGAVETSWL